MHLTQVSPGLVSDAHVRQVRWQWYLYLGKGGASSMCAVFLDCVNEPEK